MQALILTGGQGTRLRPLTLYAPKPLLPIMNAPFLSYPAALLMKHGVSEAVLCTADSLSPYRDFIRRQARQGIHINCSRETRALGTAGAIKNAERFISSNDFFVMNGDVLTDIDLSGMLRFHRKNGSWITIALMAVSNPSAYGLIQTDSFGRIRSFIEKPKHLKKEWGPPYYINAGIYLFKREIFKLIPKNRNYSSERELFPSVLQKKIPLFGYRAGNPYWLDIGTPEKFLQANHDVFKGHFKVKPAGLAARRSCRIHRSVKLNGAVVMGKGCRIGPNAHLSNCVLLDHVSVGKSCEIENCIVGGHSLIENNCRIKNVRTIGNFSRITAFSTL